MVCGGDTSCQAGCEANRLKFLQLGKLPWWTGEDEPTQIEDDEVLRLLVAGSLDAPGEFGDQLRSSLRRP